MFLYSPRKGIHQRSSGSCPYNKGNSYTCIRWCESLPFVEHRGFAESRQAPSVLVSGSSAESAIKGGFKEETHAARWGLLRGYSGKATKWVDFVVTDSTRRESCHFHRVVRNGDGVKGKLEKRVLGRVRFRELENRAGITRVGFRPSRCEV